MASPAMTAAHPHSFLEFWHRLSEPHPLPKPSLLRWPVYHNMMVEAWLYFLRPSSYSQWGCRTFICCHASDNKLTPTRNCSEYLEANSPRCAHVLLRDYNLVAQVLDRLDRLDADTPHGENPKAIQSPSTKTVVSFPRQLNKRGPIVISLSIRSSTSLFSSELPPVMPGILSTLSPLGVRATPSAADRLLRNQKQLEHVKQLWIFLACVIAFFTSIRIIRAVYAWLWKPARPDTESVKEKADPEAAATPMGVGKFSLRHLPSAIATGFRIVAFRRSVPVGPQCITSVSELAFILIYIAAMFIWLLVDTRDLQALFYQDRAAHLASSQLPLIVALAGKNNVLSWMTGVSHEKLNVLHRAAARTNLILLWLHAITRTVSGLPAQFDFSHHWMRSGAVGLTAFSLATFLSVRPIRNMAFEFFLVSHIVLILIFLFGGYFHAKQAEYGAYIWPALLVWAFDRVLRGISLLRNNRVWSSKNEHSVATIELLSEDTVRLTLRRRFSWKAGQHAYVILPTISTLPTEAHPFTIASIPEPIEGSKDKNVVFLIRGRGGFTQRLRDHATRNGTGSVPALLDGPYGCPPDLRPFSTCILIAGGSGISYTLPLLLDLIRHNVRGNNSAVRRIVFVWAVRDGEHLKWISKAITEALFSPTSSLVIEPRIYVTGSNYPIPEVPSLTNQQSDSSSVSSGVKTELELPVYSSLKLIHGRPSVRKLLHDEISASRGPVSVDVAGPANLTESIRRALSSDMASPQAVLRGLPPVTLHVESFGMIKS